MKKKKSQFAFEYISIFVILLIIFGGFFYIIKLNIISYEEKILKSELDNFAKSFEIEINLLEKASEGYNRDFKIPKNNFEKYDVNISEGVLIISFNLENYNYSHNNLIHFREDLKIEKKESRSGDDFIVYKFSN